MNSEEKANWVTGKETRVNPEQSRKRAGGCRSIREAGGSKRDGKAGGNMLMQPYTFTLLQDRETEAACRVFAVSLLKANVVQHE